MQESGERETVIGKVYPQIFYEIYVSYNNFFSHIYEEKLFV